MAQDAGRSPLDLNRRAVLGGVGATAAVGLSLYPLGRAVARVGTLVTPLPDFGVWQESPSVPGTPTG